MKAAFELPVQGVRSVLASCDDGCPNGHYTNFTPIDLKGHSLVCCNDGAYVSKLRNLRAASTLFPVLRKFLNDVHSAITSHTYVFEIDNGLCTSKTHKMKGVVGLLDRQQGGKQGTIQSQR